jgi:hypothetical protein
MIRGHTSVEGILRVTCEEGDKILQVNRFKSVEIICGYTSATHVLARRVAVLGEEVVAEVGVTVGAKVDVPRLGLRLALFSLVPVA